MYTHPHPQQQLVLAKPVEAHRSAFVNLALPLFTFSEPQPPASQTAVVKGALYVLLVGWLVGWLVGRSVDRSLPSSHLLSIIVLIHGRGGVEVVGVGPHRHRGGPDAARVPQVHGCASVVGWADDRMCCLHPGISIDLDEQERGASITDPPHRPFSHPQTSTL
jgi:hypothetical protein